MVPVLFFGLVQCVLLLVSAKPHSENLQSVQSPELSVTEKANALFEEYWQMNLRNNPETATMLGDSRYDDKLNCLSLKCQEESKVEMCDFLKRANELYLEMTSNSISEDIEMTTNLELFITNLNFKLLNLKSGSYVFPVSNLHTPQMSLIFLLTYIKLDTAEQYWNLLSRYRAFPKQIDEIIELMQEGIRRNYTLHDRSMITNHQWNHTTEDSPFYKPFLNISDSVPVDERAIIQVNASDALRNFLTPAFKKLADFMDNVYSKHTRPEIGVGSLPNGHHFYRQELSSHLTDTKVTPEEVHNLGKSEVARIAGEMEEVISLLGLNLTRKEFTDLLRQNKSQYFSSEDEAIETYRHTLGQVIPPKLLKVFKHIPEKKLSVQKVPPELSGGPQAFYMAPSAGNSTPGTFYLDTSILGNIPKYDLITLSLHEGVPGHHFQFSYAMEQTGIPEFRKYDVRSNAYIEGWALYAEYLGYELDLYQDIYMSYGHLSQEMFRACRLVVDTGMHVMNWSRQDAIDYMLTYSAASLNNIEKEVDRYITWPGQACSYKYGEIKIKELRKKAETALGDKFDVKTFHDIVLRTSGPLEEVAKQIQRYIESVQ